MTGYLKDLFTPPPRVCLKCGAIIGPGLTSEHQHEKFHEMLDEHDLFIKRASVRLTEGDR
jgi:hypothetical protein